MNSDIVAVIVAVLSSNVIVELVRYFSGRSAKQQEMNKKFDSIEAKFEDINKKLNKYEKDGVRTQLFTLMSDYPERKDEIMEVAEHYFKDLKGNWFMTGIFKDWLDKEEIDKPSWLKWLRGAI